MVNLDYFRIELQNLSGVFNPGDTVAGTISYKVPQRVKIGQVRLEALGDGQVKWWESQGSGQSTRSVTYSGYEVFYKFVQVYETKRTEQEDFYLEAGEYSHQFQFILPPVLPSSSEHSYGRNRFAIIGIVDVPWSTSKYIQRVISVISPVDLNLIPMLREPGRATESKIVCCWCCKSEPIVVTLALKKGGYVAGETLHGEITIENPTSRSIKPPTFFLRQVLCLNATNKIKNVYREAASVVLDRGVGSKSKEVFNAQLVIPAVCPSTLNTCRVFVVAYEACVYAPVSGPSEGARLAMSVVVGTVPMGAGASSSGAVLQPSVFGGIDVEQEERKGILLDGNARTFKPQYPYFKDFSSRP